MQILYLGGVIHEDTDHMVEMGRWIRLTRACYKRFGQDLREMTIAPLRPKVCMPKAEVIETLLYGCVMWPLNAVHHDEFS